MSAWSLIPGPGGCVLAEVAGDLRGLRPGAQIGDLVALLACLAVDRVLEVLELRLQMVDSCL